MSHTLQTSHLHFSLDPKRGTWSLNGLDKASPSLDDVWMQATYRMDASALLRRGQRKFQLLEKWDKAQVSSPETVESVHGNLKQISVTLGPDVNGILSRLEFALSEQHPLLLWRLRLENGGQHPVEVARLDLLRAGSFPRRKRLPESGPLAWRYHDTRPGFGAARPHPDPGQLAFFSNGWQSWSHTGSFGADEAYRDTRLGLFAAPMWYTSGKAPKRESNRFSSDMFGVLGDRAHRSGILAGFLAQAQHFGVLDTFIGDALAPALNLWADGDHARLDPGAQMMTDWAAIQFVSLDDPDPLAAYLEAVARENFITPHAHLLAQHSRREQREGVRVGWCSWYHFFQDIDEAKMRANLKSAQEIKSEIPLELFQIDDGFQAQIGDWFKFSPGFPAGVAPLARKIKEAGFTPGLWLAPFIVHSKSRLARQHKDWLLRNRHGLPVNAGFVWNNFNKALDLTVPGALDYACETVRKAAQDWGYSYLKLDFLYAAALRGRYRDRTKTRAQVLRGGLEALRQAVGPQVMLLGCGCPLGPAIGIVDAMRIGADVAPYWEPRFIPPQAAFRPEPNMPSTRNALQNILTRAPLHHRWWANDPDCLLLRPNRQLTLPEIQSLATAIALTGGSLLLSDDLPGLSNQRLRIAQQILPLIDPQAGDLRVLDWFDAPTPGLLRLDLENVAGKWHLLAVFNWRDQPGDRILPLQKFDLPAGDFFAREFWSGESWQVSEGLLDLKGIPAHGVKLVALTPSLPGIPRYLGSDLHLSQGLEVTRWSVASPNGVRFSLERPGKSRGEIELYLPGDPAKITVDQKESTWEVLGGNRYRIPVQFQESVEIEIA